MADYPPFPPTSWSEYKYTNPQRIIEMDESDRLSMMRNLTGDEDMQVWEMYKYMPDFDERAFRNIQTERYAIQREGAADIAEIGTKQQENLLGLALKQEQAKFKSGFASTGNPMIDRQRQNIYQGISTGTGRRRDTLLDDVWAKRDEARILKKDYREELGESMLDYQEKLEDEAATAEANKGFFDKVGEGIGWVYDEMSDAFVDDAQNR
jgi:hypothetical protein